MLTLGRMYANARAKVRCCGGRSMLTPGQCTKMRGRGCAAVVAWVWLGASVGVQWRGQVRGDGGRNVRGRVSEFIGTYQNLSEEIG